MGTRYALDMAAVAALSNHKMAKFWNELTGQNIKKFENRDVALEKFAKVGKEIGII